MRLFRVNTNEMNKMNESINMGLIIYTMSDPKCGFMQAVDLRILLIDLIRSNKCLSTISFLPPQCCLQK